MVDIGKSIGGIFGNLLGGAVKSVLGGPIPSIVDSTLKIILNATKDDPAKRRKALAEFEEMLTNLIMEAPNAQNHDLTPLSLAFLNLYNAE